MSAVKMSLTGPSIKQILTICLLHTHSRRNSRLIQDNCWQECKLAQPPRRVIGQYCFPKIISKIQKPLIQQLHC